MALSASKLQALLGGDPAFTDRVASLMRDYARVVLAEALATAQHAARANYAKLIMQGSGSTIAAAAAFLATTTNVKNTISYEDTGITTTVTDASLDSQIQSSWNAMAGIETGS